MYVIDLCVNLVSVTLLNSLVNSVRFLFCFADSLGLSVCLENMYGFTPFFPIFVPFTSFLFWLHNVDFQSEGELKGESLPPCLALDLREEAPSFVAFSMTHTGGFS